VDRLVRASVDKISPVTGMQEELDLLRERLAELEASLADLEGETLPRRSRQVGKGVRRIARR
jgi:hypothetical protein